MRIYQAIAVSLCCAALQVSAATLTENAPIKKAGQGAALKAKQPETGAAFDAYLQLHRDSGFAIYASPLEVIAPDTNLTPGSCAKAHVVPVN